MALFLRSWRMIALVLVTLAAVSLVAACGDDDDDDDDGATPGATSPGDGGGDVSGSIDVLGIWGDTELANFEAMVAPWESDTGASMSFTGTREITAQLNTRVEGGSPPDVAIPAEVGLFKQFASEGKLAPLSECEGLEEMIQDEYPQAFVDLGTVDGTLYGFFMKAGNKGTIFYNPAFFDENGYEVPDASASFDDLLALSDDILADGTPPWSMGQEAGGGTGFPGTDWIQQILLNEAGADTYDGVIDGSVPFTDDAMVSAWERFGAIATNNDYLVQGSASGVAATNFVDSVYPPFETPPTAAMVYMGSFAGGFITEQFPAAEAETDFDFFPFPGGAITGDANIVYVFNMTDTVCSFLKHIAGADAQRIWVELGGFTSVNNNVDLDAYGDPVGRKAAQTLLEAPAFRFDLDDAIGGALQAAFFEGVTAYIQDPGSLDSILQNIEAARAR